MFNDPNLWGGVHVESIHAVNTSSGMVHLDIAIS